MIVQPLTSRLNRPLLMRAIAALFCAVVTIVTVVACSPKDEAPNAVTIDPEAVVDYIAATAIGARTVYARHVVNRFTMLEGVEKVNPESVVIGNVTESWQGNDGIPLPAQMFRLSAEETMQSPLVKGEFSIRSISSWYINDAHAPSTDFEREAIATVEITGVPFKKEQVIDGSRYLLALFPDQAVTEACITCHNNHPVHQERYPDKVFKVGDVMGAVEIDLPLGPA